MAQKIDNTIIYRWDVFDPILEDEIEMEATINYWGTYFSDSLYQPGEFELQGWEFIEGTYPKDQDIESYINENWEF